VARGVEKTVPAHLRARKISAKDRLSLDALGFERDIPCIILCHHSTFYHFLLCAPFVIDMKTVIVEPHALIRELIVSICSEELGFEVLHAGRDWHSCGLSANVDVDFFIAAITLETGCGLSFSSCLKNTWPKCRILLVTQRVSAAIASQARACRTDGIVAAKDLGRRELRNAIDSAARGQHVSNISSQAGNAYEYIFKILSPYQQQLLSLIGAGFSDEEIAEYVQIAPSTMQSRRRDIMRKLNIHCTPKLMRFAIVMGLTQPEHWEADTKAGAQKNRQIAQKSGEILPTFLGRDDKPPKDYFTRHQSHLLSPVHRVATVN
jgi:DNA-binding NarL/FixJ family response regulator